MKNAVCLLVVLWGSMLGLRAEIKPGDNLTILIRGVPAGEKQKIEGRYVVGKSGTIRIPIART